MRRATALLALFLTVLAGPALAAECKLEKVLDLPVKMRGTTPLVSAEVDGVKIDFTVDSGSFFSLLSPTAAQMIGLKPHELPINMRVVGVGGEARDVRAVTAKKLDLGGVGARNIDFLVGGETMFPASAGGLLGQNVLRSEDIEYDLANGMIRLWRHSGCPSGASLAYWDRAAASSVTLEDTSPQQPHLQGMVSVNGVRLHATFDTGAGTSVLSVKAAARAGVTPQSPGVVAGSTGGGLGRRVTESWIAPFDSFTIGAETIRNTRLRFATVNLIDTDMLIGVDFFLSHRVYVATSERKLYFTYNGGPVFRLEPAAPVQAALPTPAPAPTIAVGPAIAGPNTPEGMREPTDAAGFSRRGAAYAARRDYAHAIADLTRAAELEPGDYKHFYDRAIARLRSGQAVLGLADLNEALKLKPDDSLSLQNRAELYLATGDEVRARADFEAAIRADPKDPEPGLRQAEAYLRRERYEAAIGYFDRWIAQNAKDSRLDGALNGRCWARAVLNRDLDKALGDCEAALKLKPNVSGYLDSRALVRLRMGQYDQAIVDYDAALKAQPKASWSLYARGLAKRAKGDKAGGDADIAAAVAIDPRTADRAKAYGLAS